MKHITTLLGFLFFLFQVLPAQNVGIGTSTPLTKLQVQTTGANYGITHTNGTVTLGTYLDANGGWIGTKSNHPLYFFTNNSTQLITVGLNGNLGIGTTSPAFNMDIYSAGNANLRLTEGGGGQSALFSRYSNRLEIQPSDAFQISVGGIDQRNLAVANNGYVGINTTTPATRLQVLTADASYGITHTNGTVTVGTYIGSGGGWLGTLSGHPLYFFTGGGSPQITVTTSGYIGIGTITPANKLEIGSMGSSGYGGNDIAFGNGTQASAIAQTVNTAWWYSNTDIALMPRGNGQGKVGINTTTPIAPLDVESYSQIGNRGDYVYLKNNQSGGQPNVDLAGCQGCTANVSIFAANNIMALEFDALSDARIKDIEDISNSESDLATLNKLQITDYTLKDKMKNGDKQFKKIIAQQVEEVYPQVVNKNVNYIPNVYQLSSKIEKTINGTLLSFKAAHNISKEAKKLQLIDKNGAQQRFDIIAVPSDKEVLINAANLNSDTVFVYGEQVNDFRTVDYDGLTTLNISATQELSKLLKEQQAEIAALKKEMEEMKSGRQP